MHFTHSGLPLAFIPRTKEGRFPKYPKELQIWGSLSQMTAGFQGLGILSGEADLFQPDFSFVSCVAFALLGEGVKQSPESTLGMTQPRANPMFSEAVWPKSHSVEAEWRLARLC